MQEDQRPAAKRRLAVERCGWTIYSCCQRTPIRLRAAGRGTKGEGKLYEENARERGVEELEGDDSLGHAA